MSEVEAIVMPAPLQPLERRRLPAPRPEAGGAVLEMVATEVCGTDVHLHHGRLPGVPYPIIPGHVSCGRILETGGTLRDVEGRSLEPGRLAFVQHLVITGRLGEDPAAPRYHPVLLADPSTWRSDR